MFKEFFVKYVFVFCAVAFVICGSTMFYVEHRIEERLADMAEPPHPTSVPKPTNMPDVDNFGLKSKPSTKLDDQQMKEIINQINKELKR